MKKAQISMYITFFIYAAIIIMIAAVLAPMGTLFNTEMYKAGEGILKRANSSINNISDPEVRDRIRDSTQEALDATENNIDMNNDLFQWSWLLVIGMTALIIFLYTRSSIEVGRGGGMV